VPQEKFGAPGRTRTSPSAEADTPTQEQVRRAAGEVWRARQDSNLLPQD
jgi:hypothetical protein